MESGGVKSWNLMSSSLLDQESLASFGSSPRIELSTFSFLPHDMWSCLVAPKPSEMAFPDNLESLLKKFSKIDQKFHVKIDSQSRRFKLDKKSQLFSFWEVREFFKENLKGLRPAWNSSSHATVGLVAYWAPGQTLIHNWAVSCPTGKILLTP